MKVRELISILQHIDGEKEVGMHENGEYLTIDPLVGVLEWLDFVQLQSEIKVPKTVKRCI